MRKPSLLERLRAKKHSPRPVIGVAWYDELNWAMVKATALDAYRFENSLPSGWRWPPRPWPT